MPASSVIFLVILLLCAGSLVPSAIRRRRHSESSRVTDRDSAALRVVVRGGPGAWTAPALASAASSRPVLGSGSVAAQRTPRRAALPVGPAVGADPLVGTVSAARTTVDGVPADTLLTTTTTTSAVAPARPSAPSRVVARRRRLVATVLALTVLGWGAVLVGTAPWWVGAVSLLPLVVVVAALTRHGASAPVRTAPAVRVVVASPRESLAPVVPPVAAPSAEATAAVPTQREESTPAPAPAAEAGSWAPVPVPLPTYLLKSKAPDRTAPAPRPTVELVVSPARDEVVDLREPVRAVNE